MLLTASHFEGKIVVIGSPRPVVPSWSLMVDAVVRLGVARIVATVEVCQVEGGFIELPQLIGCEVVKILTKRI